MARSPLLGIDRPPTHAPGHDDLALGPSDSSDSGSDLAGLDAPDTADPDLPLDRALADDIDHPLGSPDARGGGSDTAGTGERRSAAGDAGGPDGADIGVDRVFSPFGEASDVDLADVPVPDGEEVGDEDDDGEEDSDAEGTEDESADPVGDGHADADLARRLATRRPLSSRPLVTPRPGRPNPEPDPPGDQDGGDLPVPIDDDSPADDDRHHPPGRDPGTRRG